MSNRPELTQATVVFGILRSDLLQVELVDGSIIEGYYFYDIELEDDQDNWYTVELFPIPRDQVKDWKEFKRGEE